MNGIDQSSTVLILAHLSAVRGCAILHRQYSITLAPLATRCMTNTISETRNNPAFGRWLKRLRAQQDLTQERLAELAYCSVQAIRSFETGKRRPSLDMAERLAEVLQVPEEQRENFVRQARMVTVDTSDLAEPAPVPVATPAPMPTTLPTAPTTFIGRQAERQVLAELLADDRRLVSLVGTGGIGKTRLALQVAQDLAPRFRDGARFVALAAITTAAELPGAIAQAVGIPLTGASSPPEQAVALLTGRSMLLVFDNFEQLLTPEQAGQTTELIEHILQYTSDIKLLITSRERLRLHSEHVFELTGLPIPAAPTPSPADVANSEAINLFVDRARQLVHDFAVTNENLAGIVQICLLLEGSPLAIELAAAWVRALTVEEIVAEVRRNIDFLSATNRGLPGRHRSLRAVFDHSWALLSPEEQAVLPRLAHFSGGFDRTAAHEVTGINLPILAALIDKSLVRMAPINNGTVRYELHELLKQYLRDKLVATGEIQWLAARHGDYFCRLAETINPHLYAVEATIWQQVLELEQSNMRAALHWSLVEGQDPELGLRLAAALGRFWYLSGRWKEGREWLLLAQQQPVEGGKARSMLLVALGELHCLLADYQAAEECLQAGLSRWQAANDELNIAWTFFQLGNLATARGDYPAAATYFTGSLERYRALGNGWGTVTGLNQLASVALNMGDYSQAAALLAESMPLARALKRQGGIAGGLNLLGRAVLGEGDTEQANELFSEALAIFEQRKSQPGIAWSYFNLGLSYLQSGPSSEAMRYFHLALRIYQELDNKSGFLGSFLGLAGVALAQHQPTQAIQLLAAADYLRQEFGLALSHYEEQLYQQMVAQSKQAFTPETWQAIWLSGLQLSLAEAIQLAQSPF